MARNDFVAESPENYEQKCLCTLVLDVSGSMHGSPIAELNAGLQSFCEEVQHDVTTANRLEVSIVTFGSKIDTIQEPALIDSFQMPTLKADQPSTRLVDGVRKAVTAVEARKDWYRQTGQPYYRPWIILITDGAPNANQDVNGLSSQIEAGTADKRYIFFAVGVKHADMDTLTKISSPQMPPAPLEGLRFGEFFKWLSASMTAVTHSLDDEMIDLPSPANWMKGFTI